MNIPSRYRLAAGLSTAVLAALAAVAVHSLVLLGELVFAAAAAMAGATAVVALGVVLAARSDGVAAPAAAARASPAAPPQAEPQQAIAPSRRAFQLRQARGGELPAPYLAAVMKGAQATHAALKARRGSH